MAESPDLVDNQDDNPFDYELGEKVEPQVTHEPADFDDDKKAKASKRLDEVFAKGEEHAAIHPVQIVTDLATGKQEVTMSGIKIGERGFLAVLKEGTVSAPTRKELRKRIASLLANEAYSEDSEPIEIYRVTRLPLARQVNFKF